jgi:prepilin-type N-terminal cleavage/methylation domain-containing protein
MNRPPLARRRSGFTLIELMIVVVIIGILTAMAIPRFKVSSHKSKEKEADLVLKQVYTLQQTYRSNTGEYAQTAGNLATVGFTEPTNLDYYDVPTVYTLPMCMNSRGEWNDRGVDADGNIENASC